MIQRLFDIVSQQVKQSPDAVMLAAKEDGRWRTYSTREVWDTSTQLAAGIATLHPVVDMINAERQEKIALISPNRPEWLITDLAVQRAGCVLTPLYPTITPEELQYIIAESEVRILFIAGKAQYERFRDVIRQSPTLTHVYSFDVVAGIEHWKNLLTANRTPGPGMEKEVRSSSLATIIYTSGTTGVPKGVMLTHNNLVSNVTDCMPIFSFASKGEKALSFLPLNHVFERMVSYVYLNAGVSIYYAESLETIGDNLREVKPIVFTTVPRLLEKVYERIVSKGSELTGIKRSLFFWALNLAKQFDNAHKGSLSYRIQLQLADRLIFSKWREALGGKVKAVVSGSAACQERLIRIFTAAGIVVMEGYGLTETSPVIAVNRYESSGRRIGSVGPVIPNVQVRLAPDGEILVKGPNILEGYYKNSLLTVEVMRDGWFHTGDIGSWVDGHFLKITDRKKEMFKTSGGKYVAPQSVENRMKESPFIEQMLVTGNGRKFVIALVVPAMANLRRALQEQKLTVPDSPQALIDMPEAQAFMEKQIAKYNQQFASYEQVKKIVLLPSEWTVDKGELTPSLKLKRKVIEERNQPLIEALYERFTNEI